MGALKTPCVSQLVESWLVPHPIMSNTSAAHWSELNCLPKTILNKIPTIRRLNQLILPVVRILRFTQS